MNPAHPEKAGAGERSSGVLTHESRTPPDGMLSGRFWLILPLALVLLLAGCGDSDAPAGGDVPDGAPAVNLTMVRDDGRGNTETRTLSCDDGPDCDLAARLVPKLLSERDEACTDLWGGPDTFTISGSYRGEAVNVVVTRANGCEIHRFDRWQRLYDATPE